MVENYLQDHSDGTVILQPPCFHTEVCASLNTDSWQMGWTLE